jgi:hypothetical protein
MVGINGGFMAGWGSDYADVGLLVSGCGVVVFEGCLAGCNTTFVVVLPRDVSQAAGFVSEKMLLNRKCAVKLHHACMECNIFWDGYCICI